MTSPLRIEAGFREMELPTARPVTLQVLRLAVSLSLPCGGGFWAAAMPVVAIDRATTPPRRHLVVDPALILVVASVFLFMLSALSNRRARGQIEGAT